MGAQTDADKQALLDAFMSFGDWFDELLPPRAFIKAPTPIETEEEKPGEVE